MPIVVLRCFSVSCPYGAEGVYLVDLARFLRNYNFVGESVLSGFKRCREVDYGHAQGAISDAQFRFVCCAGWDSKPESGPCHGDGLG
jgi:hypothetical protein